MFDRWATWPSAALLIAALIVGTYAFNWRNERLGAGTKSPDAMGWYTPQAVTCVLCTWGESGRSLYAWSEVTLDVAYPFVYGCLFSILAVRVFRETAAKAVIAVALITSLCDWCENGIFATLAWTFSSNVQPPPLEWLAWVALPFTLVKLTGFSICLFTLLIGGLAGFRRPAEPQTS